MTRREHTKLPPGLFGGPVGQGALPRLGSGWLRAGRGGSPLTSMQAFSPAGGRDAALAPPSTPGTTAETSAVISNLKSRSAILPDQAL